MAGIYDDVATVSARVAKAKADREAKGRRPLASVPEEGSAGQAVRAPAGAGPGDAPRPAPAKGRGRRSTREDPVTRAKIPTALAVRAKALFAADVTYGDAVAVTLASVLGPEAMAELDERQRALAGCYTGPGSAASEVTAAGVEARLKELETLVAEEGRRCRREAADARRAAEASLMAAAFCATDACGANRAAKDARAEGVDDARGIDVGASDAYKAAGLFLGARDAEAKKNQGRVKARAADGKVV